MDVTVVIPTHNPHPGRLARTLAALAAQSLPAAAWETLIVDNASTPALGVAALPATRPATLRIIPEPQLGLTAARRRGFREARGDLIVLVDDDNVLAPGFLAAAVALFAARPQVIVAGGPSRPEFEAPPPAWAEEFLPLLALRDLGPELKLEVLERTPAGHFRYPPAAPIGAGMAIRRRAALAWADDPAAETLSDRRGTELTSSGDNDIVLHALKSGGCCAYAPGLALTHLIPRARLEADYLARLNRGIQRSWMQVLSRHNANPWPPLSATGARLRQARAWFTYRAWRRPAGRIRWAGACGHFAGRVPA